MRETCDTSNHITSCSRMVSGLRKNIKNIKGIALCCQIKKYNYLLYESHDDNVIGNGDDVEKIGDLEKQE